MSDPVIEPSPDGGPGPDREFGIDGGEVVLPDDPILGRPPVGPADDEMPTPEELAAAQLSPRAKEIVAVARELLEEHGADGFSMRHVAARLGIRAPSLYKHFSDKQAIRNAIVADALWDQGERLREAIDGADDPVWALVDGYRRWALAHPRLYELIMSAPLSPGPLVRAAEVHARGPLRQVMRGDVMAGMTLWSFGHGLIDLELKGRVPPGFPLEAVWRNGVDRLRVAAQPGAAGAAD